MSLLHIMTSIITYYYVLLHIITSLLRHYYIIIMSLLHIITSIITSLLRIITSLLRHYYVVIMSLLVIYYVIISSLLHIVTNTLLPDILSRGEPYASVLRRFIKLMNRPNEFLRGKAHQYHSEEAKRNASACHVP